MIFFEENHRPLAEEIQYRLEQMGALKWNIVAHVNMRRVTQDGEEEIVTAYFKSNFVIEMIESTISNHIYDANAKILQSFDKYVQLGSGWTLDRILKLELCIAKYHPLAASSFIPTPKKLREKLAILNIQNLDQKCLVWSLLAQKHPISLKKNPERVSHYLSFENEIQLGDIECPVPLIKISQVERINNIRINVFTWENDKVIPLFISEKENIECFNLMLLSNENNNHYTLIRNFSALMASQTRHREARFFCYRCLHGYSREELLKDHISYCKEHSPQRINMPRLEESIMKFTKQHYQHPIPFIIYADFESILVPISSADPASSASFSKQTNLHQACGFAYVVVGPEGRCHKKIQYYRGVNAVHEFLKALMQEQEELAQILIKNISIQMTEDDKENFKNATHCYLCNEEFRGDKCADHDHLNGKYRGSLHRSCNLKYSLRKMIPVVFHNLKQYDAHIIMQGLGKIKDRQIKVIANNMEKYISFSLSKFYKKIRVSLQFIDSYQFLTASLESLVSNL